MASRRISTKVRGFSLLEILVVMALVLMLIGCGLFFNLDDYRAVSFRNERDIVVNVLQKARSQAATNLCYGDTTVCHNDGKPHGVYFGNVGTYVIFQGANYASRDTAYDEVISAKDKAATLGGLSTVIFNQLRADAVTTGGATLSVNQGARTSVITVEPEGRIWWTN